MVALNRDLATVLGADLKATDAARILRLPGTLNHKTAPPVEVRLLQISDARVSFDELRGAVPRTAPEPVGAESVERQGPEGVSAAVTRIVNAVEGARSSGDHWTALCPAHDDQRPSLSIAQAEDGRCLVHCFAGCTTEAIVGALGLQLSDLFDPPLGDDGRLSDATRLVRLTVERGVELVHDEEQTPYACVACDAHRETMPVRERDFAGWLQHQSYRERGKTIGAQALQDAVNTLAAMARFDGEEVQIGLRVGGDRRRVVIDLGDPAWRAVEVTADGWRILEHPDLRFRRPKTSKPLPEPVRGGSLSELRQFVNVTDESWPLVLGWLVASLSPTGPYPMLWLLGEHGTAKSTSAGFLRDLVDPVLGARRPMPGKERDLMISASKCWILLFDNLTKVSEEQSNALSRLATGGGFATRMLYTDSEEVVFDVTRPVIVTGIQVRGVREDLQDRAITLELPVIAKGGRRREQEMEREFEAARPRLFGALLDAVACAIQRQDEVEPDGTVRMADAATWMTAAEPALGLPDGTIVAAFLSHQNATATSQLDADPTARLLTAHLLTHGNFEGTHSALLEALQAAAQTPTDRDELPRSAAKLSARLKEIAPVLRARGIEMHTPKRGASGTRLVRVEMDRDARDDRDA